ncbi:MAG: bifunctional riboflavin kinase/FAD synthetase [Verrucomicrobiales bacterium]|jgi:riboflavin kinase/FMN adenylyltransferase|nr:bifunctional riboflavin kinase/FAD synthetase [Verrucomicrobiales bacterium]
MNLCRSFAEAADRDIHALALGFFDGLHRGHQHVIANADHDSVLTFEPHPQAFLFPDQAPLLLTGLPHKLHDLAALGVRHAVLLPFDRQMARTTAEKFLQQLGDACPKLQRIAVGANWRFGHHRAGSLPLLRRWCAARRITLRADACVTHHGTPISSSRIRELILSGQLSTASELLGKPYSLFGTIVSGRQLGRQLGFPTANLDTLDQCLPPRGVYFGTVTISNRPYPAAINIGNQPTLAPQRTTVEAHLLNFSGDLYGVTVSVHPKQFWRAEQKFSSLSALQTQIAQDLIAMERFGNRVA